MKRLTVAGILGGLILLGNLVAGCVSSRTAVLGEPFLGSRDADPETLLRRLAAQITDEAQTVTEARYLIEAMAGSAAPHVRWEATYALPHQVSERYVWRFLVVEGTRYGLGVTQGITTTTRGYSLTAGFTDGRLAGVQVETTALTEREREWMTSQVLSLGTAALGTLFMLSLP